ncbi:hypothetical protein C8J56DRAFT_1163812 [Mycena floridula]|nr:hypothetical protein C8J56DRAFT_1163812 [Mycena floridula]
MTRIPFETSDVIIDHLHDDVPALKQCALVCKNWLPATRFHLFSVVHLSLYSIDQMLETIFHPDSHIPQYIQALHIIESQGREFDPTWVNDKLSLVPLTSMTDISFLSLTQVNFSGISSLAMAALVNIMPRVTELELTYVHFKDLTSCFNFLGAAVSLKSLAITSILFDEQASLSPPISALLGELVEIRLELQGNQQALFDYLCSTTSYNIRAVSLFILDRELNISAMVDSLARLGSLTHLHIQLGQLSADEASDMLGHHINLARNPNLRTIIFGSSWTSAAITEILSKATSVPIERVCIELGPDYARNLSDFVSLARIFTSEGSALRRARVVLSTYFPGDRSAVIARLEEVNLNEPGRIQFEDNGYLDYFVMRRFRDEFMPMAR